MAEQRIPTCAECGSTSWYRQVQYIATEDQRLAFVGSSGTTPVFNFEEVGGENYETIIDWKCDNGHEVDDDTSDLLFEYI